MVSFYREAGDGAKQIRFLAVPRQMLDCLADQQRRLLTRPVRAEQRDEGRLAGIGVAPGALAGRGLVAAMVDQIVRDLECEADVARVTAVGRSRLVSEPDHDARRLDRIFDQGPS